MTWQCQLAILSSFRPKVQSSICSRSRSGSTAMVLETFSSLTSLHECHSETRDLQLSSINEWWIGATNYAYRAPLSRNCTRMLVVVLSLPTTFSQKSWSSQRCTALANKILIMRAAEYGLMVCSRFLCRRKSNRAHFRLCQSNHCCAQYCRQRSRSFLKASVISLQRQFREGEPFTSFRLVLQLECAPALNERRLCLHFICLELKFRKMLPLLPLALQHNLRLISQN